jgi:hypothetical protein
MYDDLQRLTSGSQLHDSPDNCHQCRWCPGERYAYYFGRRRWEWPAMTPYYDIAGESEIRLCEQCAGLLTQYRTRRWLIWRHVGRMWKAQGYNVILLPEQYDRLLQQDRVRRIPHVL